MHPPLAAILAVMLAACSRSRATTGGLEGFEGTITLHTVETGGKESEFTTTAKAGKLRIDVPPPSVKPAAKEVTLGHVVYEHASNSVRLFFDTTKEYRDMDMSKRIAKDAGDTPLEKTGGHRVVAGYPCDEWSVTAADRTRTNACLATGLSYLEVFRVQFGPHGTESPLARELREHARFPLDVVELDGDGKERAHMQVTKIDRGSVDDALFALPDDYVKVDPHFGGAPGAAPASGHPRGT